MIMTMDVISALIYSVLGMLVVFLSLILLMICIKVLIAVTDKKKKEAPALAAASVAPAAVHAPEAKGTAGDIKLYDTDPRDAAMVMAIVADTLGKPLNELRFKSIKEVEE